MFRQLSGEMPMQQADILLTIAGSPGLTMGDVSKATGLSQSSVSRNVAALSTFHRLGQPGMGLVTAEVDPREPRRRVLFLTTTGQVLVTRLMRTYDPNFSLGADIDARLGMSVVRVGEEAGRRGPGANVKVPKITP